MAVSWPARTLMLAAAAAVSAGCGDAAGPGGELPSSLQILAGSGQYARVATTLPDPMVVFVADRAGDPLAGVRVTWTVTRGGGAVAPEVTRTGHDGVARAIWALGPVAGPQSLTARAGGLQPVVFTASGAPGEAVRLEIDSARLHLVALQDTARLEAVGRDGYDNAVPGVAAAWLSEDTAVAAVDDEGLVLARTNGETRVIAAWAGFGDTIEVVVRQEAAAVLATPRVDTLDAVGDTLQLSAAVRDRNGFDIVGSRVTWTSLDTGIVRVDSLGRAVARAVGAARVRAGAGAAADTVHLVARQVVARIDLQPDPASVVVGDTLRFIATARDARGVPVPAAALLWSSADSTVATVTQTGRARGVAVGRAAIAASADGAQDSVWLAVLASGLAVAAISPDTLRPGGTATITGTNFQPDPAANRVLVDGVAVDVESAAPDRLVVRLPTAGAFACEPARTVAVRVDAAALTASRDHPLAVAARRSLQPGHAVQLLAAADAVCNELAATGGRYLISVLNTATSPASSQPFELHGMSASVPAQPVLARAAARPGPRPGLETPRHAPLPAAFADVQRAAATHARILEENRRLARRLRGTAHGAFAPATTLAATAAPGDTLTLRVPAIDSGDVCGSFTEVRARRVHAGSRAVLYEDIAAPLAGSMDSLFQKLGREFDERMLPILTANFGDPLAMDPFTDGDGRVLLLFSGVVNELGNALAFVFSGDFFDRAACAASDRAEIVYAVVPTSAGSGFSGLTRENWFRFIRAVVMHEAKHIASIAERLAAAAPSLEEVWLEEGTALLAEELWARSIFGFSQHGNTAYRPGLHCEVRPAAAGCAGTPLVMFTHFDRLHRYLAAIETLSTLGPVGAGDASFYGSAWSLLRWAADHHGGSEAEFLRALTRERLLTGVQNLQARTGRSFPEMLAEWSLASATDDLAGFDPAQPRFRLPSWNTRDVFAGMNADFPSVYPRAFPLAARAIGFGSFSVAVPQLRGGTAAIFDLGGPQSPPQILQLRGPAGGPLPATLRMAIVRVQ